MVEVLVPVIELLLWATPLGLLVDIGGFLLVIRYGHALFFRAGADPAPERLPSGVNYAQVEGFDEDDERHESRRRLWARTGVGAVVFGFGLQIVGSIAAICLSGM